MVNETEIRSLVDKHFQIHKGYVIVSDQGHVDVLQLPGAPRCTVTLFTRLPDGELPVQFGVIEGDFIVVNRNVKTFKKFPRIIEGYLDTSMNTNLRQFYDFDIDVIQGTWYTDYRESQHLLKMLIAHDIFLNSAPDQVDKIMNKYAGSGKKGALACAAELVKAGFKDNARW